RREQRMVGGREPVQAALLEPLHLLLRQVRALRRLLDRQLAVNARAGEGRLVPIRDLLEDARLLHRDFSVRHLPRQPSRVSTSPGEIRSSHVTSRASRARAPSSGTCAHTSRASRTGWRRTPLYAAATTAPPNSRHDPITRSTARGSR